MNKKQIKQYYKDNPTCICGKLINKGQDYGGHPEHNPNPPQEDCCEDMKMCIHGENPYANSSPNKQQECKCCEWTGALPQQIHCLHCPIKGKFIASPKECGKEEAEKDIKYGRMSPIFSSAKEGIKWLDTPSPSTKDNWEERFDEKLKIRKGYQAKWIGIAAKDMPTVRDIKKFIQKELSKQEEDFELNGHKLCHITRGIEKVKKQCRQDLIKELRGKIEKRIKQNEKLFKKADPILKDDIRAYIDGLEWSLKLLSESERQK